MQRFLSDEAGATSIEYAMIALVIGAGLVGSFGFMGEHVQALWQSVADATPNA